MKTVKMCLIFLILLATGAMPTAGYAIETEAANPAGPVVSETKPVISSWYQRFQPHELNYAIWQTSQSDEQAAEVQYSFKYKIYDHDKKDFDSQDFYLSYTGKFDFYMNTRDSGPVINRTSNPAVHHRIYFRNDRLWIDTSLEHRSDGQVTDAKKKDDSGQYLTQTEYKQGHHQYFDGISRGANYLSVTPGMKYGEGVHPNQTGYGGEIEVQAKFFYFDEESEMTWGKYAGTGTGFSNFDLFRIKAAHTQPFKFWFFRDVTVGTEYLIGKNGFATDSVDLYLILRLAPGDFNIPLMVKAHFGPMERLSNYTQPINTIGGGLSLAY